MTSTPAAHQNPALPLLSELGRDLVVISRLRRWIALACPFVYAVSYALLSLRGHWVLAVVSLFCLSFVTYGSISHDLVHRNLNLSSKANDLLLCAFELLALRSGHAYQLVHLHHHARFPNEDDIEGAAAKMSFGRTLVEGLTLQPRIYIWALKRGSSKHAWIVFEGLSISALIVTAIASIHFMPQAFVYVALMIMGSWIIPLITSYIPHDPAGNDPLTQTRRFRGIVASVIAFRHLYHLEHHLYPSVPHQNWPALAKRLDPHLDHQGIKTIRLWF